MEEFVPMQKAAEELGITPEALKQVIAKRELSALLDGGTFKIRRRDLDRYKSRRQSEETIALPAEEVVEVAEEAEAVEEAVVLEEPTLEAIEETADTVDTEITLEELDTVQEEPPTATPLHGAVEEPAGSEATAEISLGDDLEVAVSEDIPLEGEEAATVSIEAGGQSTTQPLEVGQAGGTGDLDVPDEGAESLEARVHVLEARAQGTAWAAAFLVLTSLVLVYVGMTLWGYPQDHVPGYLKWILE